VVRLLLLSVLAFGVLLACGDPADVPAPGGLVTAGGDEDLDSITNIEEGWVADGDSLDTDLDGLPDYLDSDSDDDSLLDSFEAGDEDLLTPPVDSDLDGLPDFLDTDADDNGRPDLIEGTLDVDGDGLWDFRDLDDDGDGVPDIDELAGAVEFPPDFDGDLFPDFQDPDSDNDLIRDDHDSLGDADGDGVPNRFDLDSDGDGWTDLEEAGDEDLDTFPFNSDDDAIPDFLDLDADNDGLGDADELTAGSDHRDPDSDDDGVDDLIEFAAGTGLDDGDDNPRTRGDFVFLVPFNETPSPRRDTLDFRTNIPLADVYFVFDNSSSMSPIIESVRTAANDVLTNLSCEDFGTTCSFRSDCGVDQICSVEGRCVADPELTGCIASLHTGAGTFSSSCGAHHRYINEQSLQPDPRLTAAALPMETLGGTEDHFRTLACIADPDNCDADSACADEGIGCPGYRDASLRMVVMFSDEPNNCLADHGADCDDVNDPQTAGGLLLDEDIFFVGINSAARGTDDYATLQDEYLALGRASESLDARGQPLVLEAPSPAEAAGTISTAIREVTQNIPILVAADAVDVEDDAGDALQFIDYLEVNRNGRGACTDVDQVVDLNDDDRPDAFPRLFPGTSVCWDVVPRQNFFVRPTRVPQVFQARVIVRSDDAVLDSRTVWFLVPPDLSQDGPG
jgi:hypothetical protein